MSSASVSSSGASWVRSLVVLALYVFAAIFLLSLGVAGYVLWLASGWRPTTGGEDIEFVPQRLIEPYAAFSDAALFVPVIFAYAAMFLFLFFCQDESMGDLLKRIFVPKIVTKVLTYVYSVMLLIYILVFLFVILMILTRGTFAVGETVLFQVPSAVTSVAVLFLLVMLLPVVAWPALLMFLGTLILCFKHPVNLIPLVIVTLCSVLYLAGALIAKPVLGWWVVLVPVLVVGLSYVPLMYTRDAQSVHPCWAAFLAILRACVYVILAFVFLLPGLQTWYTRETHSKVLVLFDVSGSMGRVDVPLQKGQDPKQFNRQKQVENFLTKAYELGGKEQTFLQHVMAKSPATVYRFGAVLDDWQVEQFVRDYGWDQEKWAKFLNPDRSPPQIPEKVGGKELTEDQRKELALKLTSLYDNLTTGTNVSGAALQAAIREAGHMIQAVIIFSDGQSNLGSADTLRELHARAGANKTRKVHIITVGVGKFLQPVSIRVGDIQAPQQTRPEDDFPVQVQVFGPGLADKEFTVHLDVTRVKKEGDKWVPDPSYKTQTITKSGKFKGGGEHPFDTVEFPINVRKLGGFDPKDETNDDKLEGYWQFEARVPRLPEENSPEAEHLSKRPARVLVQKRKLRVLLFAGGPSREYQFVRTVFYREMLEKRVEMSIYLQSASEENVDQDVPKERLLTRFPPGLGKSTKPGESLSEFDVIIAFDPDWSALTPEHLQNLKQWVGGADAGGLIFVAGPVNSYQLARPGGRDISDLQSIIAVKLKDARIHGITHDSSRPYRLNLADNFAQYGFMNLTENEKNPKEGWDLFFWDGEVTKAVGEDAVPVRGMFNYYPVEKIRPATAVLATFAGPPTTRINDGRDEQPYIAIMPFGPGLSVYIGSAEMWRLREVDEELHKRFWLKLARYAGRGNLSRVNRHGLFLAAQKAATGMVNIEAQILGADLQPLPRDSRPVVEVIPPKDFDPKKDKDTPKSFKLEARSKEGDWTGWFSGKFKVFTPGDYTLRIRIPGTAEELSHDISIYRPDPELDNPRPDHAHLYAVATPAKALLDRMDEKKQRSLRRLLQAPVADGGQVNGEAPKDDSEGVRLYFPLEQAHVIPELLTEVKPERFSTKGGFLDLWDQPIGGRNAESVSSYYLWLFLPLGLGLLLTVMLLANRQWLGALLIFFAFGLFVGGVLAADFSFAALGWEWPDVPLRTTLYYVLLIVPAAIGLFTVAILLTLKRWIFAAALTGVCLLLVAAVAGINLINPDLMSTALQIQIAYVQLIVVGLLSLEWLTRKLLRLA